MTTIDRYLIKTFLSSFLILLGTGIGLYVFSDVVLNLDEYSEGVDVTVLDVLQRIATFHGNKLPLYFYQLGGPTMAIAACFTFAIMLRNNELTPLVAAGVPLQRLAVPILLTSLVLVVVWLVNSEVLIPANAAEIARDNVNLAGPQEIPVVCVRDDENAILSADELQADEGWMRKVFIIEPDDAGNPTNLIAADQAWYDPSVPTWRLQRGTRMRMGAAFESGGLGSAIEREPIEAYPFTLRPDQIRLRQSSKWAELMSIRQMTRLVESRNLPNLPAIYKARDIRFTQPLLIWILILISVPFFLTREPVNVLAAGGKALVWAAACFGFTFLAHAANVQPVYAQLAVWLPVLVFGPAAVLHMANVKS
jgi:lipopolysaccharide export system permease protein